MDKVIRELKELAKEYNNNIYFIQDPISFPKHFYNLYIGEEAIYKDKVKQDIKYTLKDIEISAIFAAHLAWGRRELIIRDLNRLMDEMQWEPYNYILKGNYRADNTSLHRTIKWSDFANICNNLKEFYNNNNSLEILSIDQIREQIYGQKRSKNCANKKINMLLRWMVRDDGVVDLGVWKNRSKAELIIPLDIHVFNTSKELGITKRKSADLKCALEITEFLKRVFPTDPCKGDFALFAHSITRKKRENINSNISGKFKR